ncbi:MAG: 3-hydroxyacyl-ACP dehydratase FabZ [Clostridium sp.]|nr:3-hydroxyacyl-ACP dehydratase FabZ [Clostridium sp.]
MDEGKGFSLNAIELQKYQLVRYPFLMIDYVTEVIPGKSAKGYKNLSNNDWFFPVHFQGNPIMPGTMQLEAISQMIAIAITTLPDLEGKITYFISSNVKFFKEVVPGDRFDIETDIISWRRGICKGKGRGYVNGQIVCEAELTMAVPDEIKKYSPLDKK